ncbi:MAG: hypothetical protein P8Y72_12195 [Anaerolineales bacterium]
MERFKHTINIQRPIEQDFAFLANGENNHKWKLEIVESRRLMDGLTRVGTRWLHVRQVLGRGSSVPGSGHEREPGLNELLER